MLFRQPFGAYAKSCTIFDKNKDPFATVPSKKIKTTCNRNGGKKVNNMPNLQSMSQAKGYGRLYKKTSLSETCSCEIVRISQHAYSI